MRKFRSTVTAIVLVAIASDASILPYCRSVLSYSSKAWTSSRTFVRNTYDRRGMNFLFTPTENFRAEDLLWHLSAPTRRLGGAIKIHSKFDAKDLLQEGIFQLPFAAASSVFSGTVITFHPLQAFRHSVADPMVEEASEHFHGKSYRTSVLVNAAGGMLVYGFVILGFYGLLNWIDRQLALGSDFENIDALFDFGVRDYRGHLYFPGLNQEDLKNESVVYSIGSMRRAFDDYYVERMKYKVENLRALRLHFQEHMALMPIRNFLDRGVDNIPGFFVSARGGLSESKKDQVFLIEDQLLMDFELAYLLSGQEPMSKVAREYIATPEAQSRLNTLKNDMFIQGLIKESVGKASKTDLMYWIQAYLYWDRNFRLWDVVGIKKYKIVNVDGQPKQTLEFITMDDIKREILQNLTAGNGPQAR